ncbi:MAG: hypothetical protein PCFJNLEI_00351 [Verrucomicrobiae bacterium]|nr:hypothetical protein [Verrucomicrobiae bacterium]
MSPREYGDPPPFDEQFSEQLERIRAWVKHSLPRLLPIVIVVAIVLWLSLGGLRR